VTVPLVLPEADFRIDPTHESLADYRVHRVLFRDRRISLRLSLGRALEQKLFREPFPAGGEHRAKLLSPGRGVGPGSGGYLAGFLRVVAFPPGTGLGEFSFGPVSASFRAGVSPRP